MPATQCIILGMLMAKNANWAIPLSFLPLRRPGRKSFGVTSQSPCAELSMPPCISIRLREPILGASMAKPTGRCSRPSGWASFWPQSSTIQPPTIQRTRRSSALAEEALARSSSRCIPPQRCCNSLCLPISPRVGACLWRGPDLAPHAAPYWTPWISSPARIRPCHSGRDDWRASSDGMAALAAAVVRLFHCRRSGSATDM